MNESDLEKELRSLRPKNPSAQLAERIAVDLKAPRTTAAEPAAGLISRPAKPRDLPRLLRPWLAALCGAAVVLISTVAFTFWKRPAPENLASQGTSAPTISGLSETPDESIDELIATTDEGLVYDAGEEPQRQVRITYLERHTWTNPQTGAVVEIEVPREDIVLMPVAMQ